MKQTKLENPTINTDNTKKDELRQWRIDEYDNAPITEEEKKELRQLLIKLNELVMKYEKVKKYYAAENKDKILKYIQLKYYLVLALIDRTYLDYNIPKKSY